MTDHQNLVLPALFALSVALHSYWVRRREVERMTKKTYDASCHCGAVKFRVKAPLHLVAWNCNCSVCFMKKNWHFVIPASDLTMICGEEFLTVYQFNTKVAKHKFCRVCGVQAYYHPRWVHRFALIFISTSVAFHLFILLLRYPIHITCISLVIYNILTCIQIEPRWCGRDISMCATGSNSLLWGAWIRWCQLGGVYCQKWYRQV